MPRIKQITPADRMAQELLRLRRELDTILAEFFASADTDAHGSPTLSVVDPLQRQSNPKEA